MKLLDWRRKAGLTQAQIADLIGVAQPAVTRYEAGRHPRPEIMRRIITATGGEVTAADFYATSDARAA